MSLKHVYQFRDNQGRLMAEIESEKPMAITSEKVVDDGIFSAVVGKEYLLIHVPDYNQVSVQHVTLDPND